MAVEINGKIYRNVKGGEEGVFINGQPIGGGGTQLYKHVAEGKLGLQGDIYSVRFIFVTTRKTSLVGVGIESFDNYISGTAEIYYGEWMGQGIILSPGDLDIYVPSWSEITPFEPDYENPNFLSDTVTEL